MPATTVIHARTINGKYHFSFAGIDHSDPEDSLVFEIDGSGEDKAPRSAPHPATQKEIDDWISRLRNAGYRVTERRRPHAGKAIRIGER
jgi:hypothetical protein